MKFSGKIKLSFNSPVVIGFTLICFLALVLGWITRGFTTNALFSVYRSSLLSPLTYVRLFGHVFGHANWEHFYWQYYVVIDRRAAAGRKIWIFQPGVCHYCNSAGNRNLSLYIFSARTVAWRKRRGICVYSAFAFH